MSRYVVSPDARADLDHIFDYIAEENLDAAERFLEQCYNRFTNLIAQPRMGEARPDLGAALRQVVLGQYLILYQPTSDGVEILRVIHGARDVPATFRRRPRP